MRARHLIVSLAVAFWLTAPGTAHADPFTFDALPAGGAISGVPGSTIGWGYVLTNTSLTEWLVATSVSADVFQFATPNALIFDLPILAPGASVTVSYIAGTAGLFEITWDLTAAVGFVNSGLFTFSGEWWSDDPLTTGQFLQAATDQSTAYSATVAGPTAVVPEPSSLLLLATGLAGWWRCRRRRIARPTSSPRKS